MKLPLKKLLKKKWWHDNRISFWKTHHVTFKFKKNKHQIKDRGANQLTCYSPHFGLETPSTLPSNYLVIRPLMTLLVTRKAHLAICLIWGLFPPSDREPKTKREATHVGRGWESGHHEPNNNCLITGSIKMQLQGWKDLKMLILTGKGNFLIPVNELLTNIHSCIAVIKIGSYAVPVEWIIYHSLF